MTKKAQTSRRDTKSQQTLSTRKALAKGRTYEDGFQAGVDRTYACVAAASKLARGRPMVWEDLDAPVRATMAVQYRDWFATDLRRTSMYGSLERAPHQVIPFDPPPKPSFLSRIMWWR